MIKKLRSLIFSSAILLGGGAAAADIISSGDFFTVTPGKDTVGTVHIIRDHRGDHYVRLGTNFSTDAAPALYVVLHERVLPDEYNSENSFMVSELKKVSGRQYYRLPRSLDISRFKSVIIWCEEFDVTFGTAELR